MKRSVIVHAFLRMLAIGSVLLVSALNPSGRGVLPTNAVSDEYCNIQCASGAVVGCGPIGHRMWWSVGDENANGIPEETCHTGYCSQTHPCWSALSAAIIDALNRAAITGDIEVLNGLLVSHAGKINLNKSRHALQVGDCAGRVAAHLPIRPEVILALGAGSR